MNARAFARHPGERRDPVSLALVPETSKTKTLDARLRGHDGRISAEARA